MSVIVGMLTSPSGDFNGWYDTNEPQHHSHWPNTICYDPVKPIEGEHKTEKPQARLPRADMIMEQSY